MNRRSDPNEVLALLPAAREVIEKKLKLSRSAVEKRIRNLRRRGYPIVTIGRAQNWTYAVMNVKRSEA